MIISVSRRTDMPAFYASWFFNRFKEVVLNIFNNKKINPLCICPAVVDCLVFWTKNPAPMLSKLDRLRDYPYDFQFTLNP